MKLLYFIAAVVAFAAPAFPQGDTAIQREGDYWVKSLQGDLPVNGNVLRVRLLSEGNLTVRGGPASGVHYQLLGRIRAHAKDEAAARLRDVDVKIKNNGEWLYIWISGPHRDLSNAELTLTVPQNLREGRFQTESGNVTVSGITGSVRAATGGGRINMDGLGADALAQTAGGDIRMGTIAGAVQCTSGGGSISIDRAGGSGRFDTAGGNIGIREVVGEVNATTAGGNIHIERAGGTIHARTQGGVIEVGQAGGLVTAETAGGTIQVSSANSVHCETGAGSIRLKNVNGALHAATGGGNIMVQLNGGLQDSRISTSAGDITIFLASNIAVTVVATNQTPGSGRIVSEFSEIRVGGNGEEMIVPVIAQGKLNGGGPVLRLFANGGTIYLKREK